jgi:ligand-binding sensor domain-containing protein
MLATINCKVHTVALVVLIVLNLLMTACGPATTSAPVPASPSSTPSPTNTAPAPTATPPPGLQPGWRRFTAADVIADEDERNFQAIAVTPDNANGALWLGTDLGIYRFHGETWETHTALGRGVSVDVLSLAVGPAGAIWAGTREGLTRFDGRNWTRYRRNDYCEKAYCPELKWIFAIAVAPDGALWLADGWKLHRFDGKTWTTHKPYPSDDERSHDIRALAITPGGDVWFATADGAHCLEAQALALTGEFTGWRYYGDGSFHLLDQTATHYTDDDGLPSNHVEAIAVAPDGVVWFGTDRGAARFDGQTWRTVTTADGLPDNRVRDIAIGPDGALWFLVEGGIVRYVPQGLSVAQPLSSPSFTPIPTCTPTRTPIPTQTPTSPPPTPTPTPLPDIFQPVAAVDEILPGGFQRLHAAPDGDLWMITDQGAAERTDETWRVRLADSDSRGQIVGIDAAGRVWAASEDTTQIAAWDGAAWITYGADVGWSPVVTEETWYRAVDWGQSDRRGRFWLSTSEDVRAFDGQRWTVYSPEDMGMGPPEREELLHDFHVTILENTEQVWVGVCEWAGVGPAGGRGVRWFDGQAWHGADSPVASGCAMVVEEDDQGHVWMGVEENLWRYDPVSGDWARFTPPENLPGEGWRRYGAVTDIALDAAGDPWVTMLLCGGAGCEDEALYHVRDEVWTQVGEVGLYTGPLIEVDSTPWLFGGGIYRVEGAAFRMVVPLLVQSAAVDGAGQVWFVAQYQHRDTLWILDAEDGD